MVLAFLAGNMNRPTKNFMKKKRKTGTMKYGVRYSAGWSAGALAWTCEHTHPGQPRYVRKQASLSGEAVARQ
jgi:hypothetical protein